MIAGPGASKDHKYSCVCLHSDRNPQERRGNLEKFKVDTLVDMRYATVNLAML